MLRSLSGGSRVIGFMLVAVFAPVRGRTIAQPSRGSEAWSGIDRPHAGGTFAQSVRFAWKAELDAAASDVCNVRVRSDQRRAQPFRVRRTCRIGEPS